MNILFIYPKYPDTFWSFNHALKFIRKKAAYPPLGLLAISAYLKQKDFGVEVFDSTFATPADFKLLLDEQRPKIVGLYANLMTKSNVLKLSESSWPN